MSRVQKGNVQLVDYFHFLKIGLLIVYIKIILFLFENPVIAKAILKRTNMKSLVIKDIGNTGLET